MAYQNIWQKPVICGVPEFCSVIHRRSQVPRPVPSPLPHWWVQVFPRLSSASAQTWFPSKPPFHNGSIIFMETLANVVQWIKGPVQNLLDFYNLVGCYSSLSFECRRNSRYLLCKIAGVRDLTQCDKFRLDFFAIPTFSTLSLILTTFVSTCMMILISLYINCQKIFYV